MDGIHLLKEMLQEVDWIFKSDWKNAYFAVSVYQDHRQYLQTHRKDTRYWFNYLPFGLLSTPRVFMDIRCLAIAWMIQLGCRVHTYINNSLTMAPMKEETSK